MIPHIIPDTLLNSSQFSHVSPELAPGTRSCHLLFACVDISDGPFSLLERNRLTPLDMFDIYSTSFIV